MTVISKLAVLVGLAIGLTKAEGNNGNLAALANQGQLTYYNPGLGACGYTNGDGEMIVAISKLAFDPSTPNGNPNLNPLCGRMIRIERNGATIDVKVVDRCEGCQVNDLDVSPTAFQRLATLGEGRVSMTWSWL